MSGSKARPWISTNAVSLESGRNLHNPVIFGIKGGKTTESGVEEIPDGKLLRLIQASPNGAANEAGRLVDVELLHYPRAMRFCRLDANSKDYGNFLRRFSS